MTVIVPQLPSNVTPERIARLYGSLAAWMAIHAFMFASTHPAVRR